MPEELQQNMQMKLCQASDEALRAIAEEFKFYALVILKHLK